MNKQNNIGKELSDEELMSITGGLSFVDTYVFSINGRIPHIVALYGIQPVWNSTI